MKGGPERGEGLSSDMIKAPADVPILHRPFLERTFMEYVKDLSKPEYLEADQNYIRDRNSCIPEAEWFANKHCGKTFTGHKMDCTGRDKWNRKWTKTFIRRMDHLYNELSKKKGTGNETSDTQKGQGGDLQGNIVPGDQDQATETREVFGLRVVGDEVKIVFPDHQPV